jgi:uncharacterized membrane protein (UPF0127 family)
MIQKLQIIFIVLVIPVAALYWYLDGQNATFSDLFRPNLPIVHIGDVGMRVEIVESDAERSQGLSGREGLGVVEGMLFVFPENDRHGIWMKDMLFAIDILWVNQDLKIVAIEENVLPETYPKVFRPARDARYVIETNAHYVESFGIEVGDTVRLPLEMSQDR